MRDHDIPSKTQAGRDEIDRRTRRLAPVLRSLLLVVDGQRSVAELRAMAASLHGPGDALEQLQALGLVGVGPQPAATPSAAASASAGEAGNRYSVLYALMSDAVREQLGLRGYFLQLKIERCVTLAELVQVLPELRAAVGKARDAALADELDRRLRTAAQL